jgi:hypothetical protein
MMERRWYSGLIVGVRSIVCPESERLLRQSDPAIRYLRDSRSRLRARCRDRADEVRRSMQARTILPIMFWVDVLGV